MHVYSGFTILILVITVTYDAENTAVPSADDPFPDLTQEAPLPILIRASNGEGKRDPKNKVRLSTVVSPDELNAFYARYADVCKAGMTALKPRDRSKKKAKAKKKKVAA